MTALGGLVVSHSIRVGGYELDEAIVRAVQHQERLLIGQEQAEALKIEVGAAIPDVAAPLTGDVAGRDISTGLLRRASVDAEHVRRALEQPLTQIIDALRNLLERTPAELSADIAERGLTLVGGGALLRGLDELIHRRTGLLVTIDDEPLTTVARGAGKALEAHETIGSSHGPHRKRGPRFR